MKLICEFGFCLKASKKQKVTGHHGIIKLRIKLVRLYNDTWGDR